MTAVGVFLRDFELFSGETGSGAERPGESSRRAVLHAVRWWGAVAGLRASRRRRWCVLGRLSGGSAPRVSARGSRHTHCLHTRGVVAMLRRLDAVAAAAREPTRLAREPRQFRDGVVPTQAKTTRRWRWLLIGEGLWRTRRRRKRPRSRAWGGVTCFRVPVDYIGRAL